MTLTKNIIYSVFVGGAICGLIYLGLKSNNVEYEEALAPLLGDADSPPGTAADAGPSGGSRKRRGKKVKKSRRKGKKH
jgi:hypothetical protein